ncbi:MAG TPA: hypothetical protein VK066_19720 [Chloroflexota bacterium]|nr:hypothetical protein [Chloroflexota bacterium]
MLRITGRTWGITLLVGLLGALLGFGMDLALHTEGWAIVVASMGLCTGAAFAGALATPQPRLATAEAGPDADASATAPEPPTE